MSAATIIVKHAMAMAVELRLTRGQVPIEITVDVDPVTFHAIAVEHTERAVYRLNGAACLDIAGHREGVDVVVREAIPRDQRPRWTGGRF